MNPDDPRNVYHPDRNQAVKTPCYVPNVDDDDSTYEAYVQGTDWGQRLFAAMPFYDLSALNRGNYVHVSARELVSVFLTTPESHLEKLLRVLIDHRVIVQGFDLSSLPSGCKVTSSNIHPVAVFDDSIMSDCPPSFETDVIYIYSDASVYTLTDRHGSPISTYAGWGYVIFRNNIVVDEGTSMGPTIPLTDKPTAHMAELDGINLAVKAGYIYMNSLSKEEQALISQVCVRSDSQGAISQSRRASLLWRKDIYTQRTLWSTYSMRQFFDIVKYEHVPRELNRPADVLASYARSMHQFNFATFNRRQFDDLCQAMIKREVIVSFKIKGVKQGVIA